MTRKLLIEQFNETVHNTSDSHGQTKIGGLFSSTIHLNFIGNLSKLRESQLTYDNNFFVTAWVLQFLFELRGNLGIRTNYDNKMNESVYKAIKVLPSFHDKNRKSNDLSISFWQEFIKDKVNTTRNRSNNNINNNSDWWCAGPENLLSPLSNIDNLAEYIYNFCEIENKIDPNSNWFEKCMLYMKDIIKFASIFLNSFGIPSDMDDSSVGLTISTYFIEYSNIFGGIKTFNQWFNNKYTNSLNNIISFCDNLSKYAYRPLNFNNYNNSNGNGINIIDTRTYYWLRNFIYESS